MLEIIFIILMGIGALVAFVGFIGIEDGEFFGVMLCIAIHLVIPSWLGYDLLQKHQQRDPCVIAQELATQKHQGEPGSALTFFKLTHVRVDLGHQACSSSIEQQRCVDLKPIQTHDFARQIFAERPNIVWLSYSFDNDACGITTVNQHGEFDSVVGQLASAKRALPSLETQVPASSEPATEPTSESDAEVSE